MDDGVERGRVVLNGVGAEVRLELAVDGEDGAVATESHLHLVRLLAIVTGGHEVLLSRLHPLHRPLQSARHRGNEDLLGVGLALGAEAASDIRRNDADPFGRQSEHVRDGPPHQVQLLRRGDDDEHAGKRILVGQHAAGLNRDTGAAGMVDPLMDDDVGGAHRGFRLPDAPLGDARHVVGPRFMDPRAAGQRRRRRCGDR